MQYYLEIAIKLIVTVFLLLTYVKISGKSQLAPTSAFDQVGNMVVGAIGGTTLLNSSVSIIDSAIFMGIWVFILIFIRRLKFKNLKIKEFFDGKRLQLVRDEVLLPENFMKANLSIRDVEILLHNEGVLGFLELENLWFETNGELSYDKKGNEYLSLLVIEEGKLDEKILNRIGKDISWIEQELKKNSIEKIEDVFCAEWVEEKLWIYKY